MKSNVLNTHSRYGLPLVQLINTWTWAKLHSLWVNQWIDFFPEHGQSSTHKLILQLEPYFTLIV